MSLLETSEKIKKRIEEVAEAVAERVSRSSVKTYKAKVTTAPSQVSGSTKYTCGITLVGDETELTVLCPPRMQDVVVGDIVWVQVLYSNWKNAVLWQKYDFSTDTAGGDGGTVVYVGGQEVDSLSFTSDPQTQINGKLAPTGDGSDVTVTFSEGTKTTVDADFATGSKLSVLWGKVKAWFKSLKAVAFSGSYNDLSDTPTIPTDYVDLTTAQTISGEKTFTASKTNINKVHITDTGSSAPNIYGDSYVLLSANGNGWGSGNTNGQYVFENAGFRPSATRNGAQSLGNNSARWKELYTNDVYNYGALAYRGVDRNTTYQGCYLVAYVENLPTYQVASARIIAQDWDTVNNNFEISVKAYFGYNTANSVKTYGGAIKVIATNGTSPLTVSANNFFIVMRTTNATGSGGTNRVELWYKQTETYARYGFCFIYDNAQSRTNNIVKWKKVQVNEADDYNYAVAGTVAYMDNTTNYPTFIPTASFVKSTFISGDFVDGAKDNATDTTTAKTIYSDNNNNATWASNVFGAAVSSYATTPNVNGIIPNDVYTAAPSTQQSAQYLARDKNSQYLGGMRVFHHTNGVIQAQLMTRSQNTNNQGLVVLEATANSSPSTGGAWRFFPNINGTFDLGLTNYRWRNFYLSGNISDGVNSIGVTTLATPKYIHTMALTREISSTKHIYLNFSFISTQYTAYALNTFLDNADIEIFGVSGYYQNGTYCHPMATARRVTEYSGSTVLSTGIEYVCQDDNDGTITAVIGTLTTQQNWDKLSEKITLIK